MRTFRRKLFRSYPKRGQYDEGEPEGMEDEAVEAVVAANESLSYEDGDADVQDAAAEAIDSDNDPDQFDAGDWVSPDEARETYAPKEGDLRCHGDIAADTKSRLSFHNTRSTSLLDFECKIRAYKDCYDSLRALQCPISHSLSETVERVRRMERKCLHQARKCPA